MLTFGPHEDVVFENAPLTSVICQVKFPPIYPLLSPAALVGFQESLEGHYYAGEPDRGSPVAQTVNGKVVSFGESAPTWRFLDETETWVVGLSVDFVSLEAKQYRSIGEFAGRMSDILAVLYRVLRPRDTTRIGLRKINALPVDTEDTRSIAKMVRPEIGGVLSDAEIASKVAGIATQIQFRDDEDTQLVVRVGPGQSNDEPAFLLDMDYATTRPYMIDDTGSIAEVLREFSEGITSFFHWALLDDFKMSLRPHPRSETERHFL